MAKFVKVATTDALKVSTGGHHVDVAGQSIAVFHLEGQYYAIANTCPHAGGPLAEGAVEGRVVTCPWHGSRFDVTSGACLSPPATQGVKSFPIRVAGNDLEIEVP